MEPTPFGDKYVLIEHIATGGMAEIYRANYSGIEGFAKELVIKRLREEYGAQPSVVDMFLAEARVAATLTHNNVVHTYDLGEILGEYYIAMELLKGQELVEVLRRSVKTGYILPLHISLGIIMQTLEGLHYVHARKGDDGQLLGLCHRDINPTNVHVGYDGLCKVVDFGIAATRASLEDPGGDGRFAGKLSYMSPEQVMGQGIDMRADIFALGIVLYEMCLSRRLFRGPRQEVADRIVEGDIPPPTFIDPEFPPSLEAIIMKALEVPIGDRYQNCDHMYRDLDAFMHEYGLTCTPRMISAYMAEMFGEGAPAEVNYDDQYDDLVDEALDFEQFESLAIDVSETPEWVQSLEAGPAPKSGPKKKRTMTIGNLEALVRNIRVDTSSHDATESDSEPTTGTRSGTYKRVRTGREKAVAKEDSGSRRRPRSGNRRRVTTGSNRSTGSRAPLSTSSLSAVDPSMSVTTGGGSFGHSVMSGQKAKRSSAAI
ncbi:MAG: serine/threonine protein kinase, partial [Nannocystaceae bacterium]